MKILCTYIILISICFSYSESDKILKSKHRECSFFQPMRFGINDKIDISTHPLFFFVIPNAKIKHKLENHEFTVRYSFHYPTPLMRILQKEGKFGIITPEADVGKIPHMVGIQIELLKSLYYLNTLFTVKTGLSHGIIFEEELDKRLTIDVPIVYPRLGEFFNDYAFNFGLDVRRGSMDNFYIIPDIDIFVIPNEKIFYESKLLVNYMINQKWNILIGTKLTFGNYPFGDQWRLFPLFDLTYRWSK